MVLASAAGVVMAILGFIAVYLIRKFLDKMEAKWS